jgi:4-amino-4-deoxy-L-arabinose transferase-like glycosyltransferase
MTLVLEARQDTERVVVPRPQRVDRFPMRLVVLAMVGSVALRARFISTPLSADEGGYLAVARAWASGKSLYTEAWVDRPQGLLLLFRFWDRLTGGSAEAIRMMAILFGCLAVAAVAYTVFAIAGQRAAGIAALLVAVASANARIEGFIANGELLAGAVAAAGVATACAHLFRGRGQSWLFISGVLAGCAVSIKQSGFDGFLAVLVCVVAGGLTGERAWRETLRECAVCVAGLATVLAALLIHGVSLGFSSWWYAVAGYRIGGINASDGDWHRFGVTGWIAAPTIVPLLVAAIFGLVVWLARDRRITRSRVLLPAWVCFASLAFVTGGLFHRHYWVTLTFPLAAAAAVGIAARRRLRINSGMLIAVVCLVALPSLISTAHVVELERRDAALVAHDDPRLVVNEQVGKWYADHRTPDSTLYALCASAALYAYADAIPPFPYLWLDGVQHGRGAQEQLVDLFSGDHPPTFVAEYQSVSTCNPSGRVAALLFQRYEAIATVAGARILVLRDVAADESLSGRDAFSTVT